MNQSKKGENGADWLFDEENQIKCKEDDVIIKQPDFTEIGMLDFKKLKIPRTALSNGIVFIWIEKEYI